MRHQAASLLVLLCLLFLFCEAVSQDLPGGDQRSTMMEQSDFYRRRIESREPSKAIDASRSSLLERSDTRLDYVLTVFIGLPLVILLFVSSRRYKAKSQSIGKKST